MGQKKALTVEEPVTGYIESWGRGIDTIKNECKSAGAREPDIRYDFGGVQVTFTGEIPVKSDANSISNSSVKTPVETREKTREKLIAAIIRRPQITTTELAIELGITIKGVDWQIVKLKTENRIRRIGPDKGGHWEVVEKK